ncbi:MAG TPA: hypothetical protein VGE94_02290, partial [Chloroflexota bacterium]
TDGDDAGEAAAAPVVAAGLVVGAVVAVVAVVVVVVEVAVVEVAVGAVEHAPSKNSGGMPKPARSTWRRVQ